MIACHEFLLFYQGRGAKTEGELRGTTVSRNSRSGGLLAVDALSNAVKANKELNLPVPSVREKLDRNRKEESVEKGRYVRTVVLRTWY